MSTTATQDVETRLEAIRAVLDRHQFTVNNERELQDLLAVVFADAGLNMSREVVLSSSNRIDFVVDRIGVEVKTGGSWHTAARQVQRYAASEDVDAMLLVTTVYEHLRLGTMHSIGGKRVAVHYLRGAL